MANEQKGTLCTFRPFRRVLRDARVSKNWGIISAVTQIVKIQKDVLIIRTKTYHNTVVLILAGGARLLPIVRSAIAVDDRLPTEVPCADDHDASR